MSDLLARNRYFDDLAATPGLQWLGQNTNHIPAHPAVLAAMRETIDNAEFNAYAPPLGFEALRAAIADDLGFGGTAEVLVTEGGVNALALICEARCRPGRTFVTTDPSWKWPLLFARRHGAEVIEIPIYDPACAYKLTPAALDAAVDSRTALVYLVDPNNPLGVTYSRAEIEAFTAIAARVGALFVHDCTYRDFAHEHHPADVGGGHAVVTVSFSKWLGLAGMRIGALAAAPALFEEMAGCSNDVLGASVMAQRAAQAGLAHKTEWMERVRRIDGANKAMIREAVLRIDGMRLPVDPSHGNFLTIETIDAGIRPEALVECFRRHGIMIRQGTYHTARFGHRFVKISTSVPTEWVENLCRLLPILADEARKINDVPPQF